jgi:hypothetical protein
MLSLCCPSVKCTLCYMFHFASSSLVIVTYYKVGILLSLPYHLAQGFRHHNLAIQVHYWRPPAIRFTNLLPYYVREESVISLLLTIFYLPDLKYQFLHKNDKWQKFYIFLIKVYFFAHKLICIRKE